jgi:hypothetical protein
MMDNADCFALMLEAGSQADCTCCAISLEEAVTLPSAGPAGIGIYSLGQRSFERLTDRGDFPRWLSDGRRLLFEYAGKLYLVNSRSKKVHEVLSVTPYEVFFTGKPSRDDHWIYFALQATEADVWQMSLGDANN